MKHQAIKPEIMSPAGYWPQLQAAIEAGADAVYFGLNHFTARAKVGFTLQELPEVMRTLHQRGVKGYVTFNTLVFEHELAAATAALAAIAAADADSIIVQDVGVAKLARQIAPELEIHGSTQMSISSAEGVAFAQQFGVTRVVLARELALDDIRTIRAQTDCELEVFVHGALCVSYSGQCFSSEAWGGRSANRGQCAQACRLPYELIVDDELRPLGAARYLLSPGDLYALEQVPELVAIGVSALKIEGRYKDANYVALTTRAYREAVDAAWAGHDVHVDAHTAIELEQVYSRGLGAHFISGTNHQQVVSGRSPRHRGVLLGQVAQVGGSSVIIEPSAANAIAPLKPGDGLVFDAADWRSPEEPEEGGRVYQVAQLNAKRIELHFKHGALNFRRIRPGDLVWRSDDPDLDKLARPFTAASAPVHKQPLHVQVTAHVGQPLQATWSLVEQPDISVTVQSEQPLEPSQNRALSVAALREQFGRLGNTPYALAALELDAQGQPFGPVSLLNTLRRDAVAALIARQSQPLARQINDPLPLLEQARTYTPRAEAPSAAPQLHVLVRTPEQLAAVLPLRPASITLDYLELYGLRPAVEQIQAAGIVARVASPRVLKPSEQRVVRFLLKLGCEIVVRSSGLLQALQAEEHPPLIGDFSLNAANTVAAQLYLQQGLQRVTPTHDLNAAQVADLARTLGPAQVEAIAYQHLPVFHTEHCVFCRFLSSGTSFKDCGHPCEQHRVALRDVNGREHPVMADVGCRNTVFGAEAQTADQHLDEWRSAGIRHFRLEFVHESGAQAAQITSAFAATLADVQTSAWLSAQLKQIAPQGTTVGSLFVPDDYLRIPLMQ